ncbi:MAG: MerR family transcriptional regulator [Romboutsia timonensis]
MYRIGQFSILSKVTIKTLRFYEAEGLLKPSFIDRDTGYRYYEASQLVDISKIISLRQIGLSISDIKRVLSGGDVKEIFEQRKREIEDNIRLEYSQLSKINYLLEDNMENQIVFKELPGGIVYYKEGMIKDYSEIAMFVLQAGEECQKINPTLKCVEPGYCYVNYLDGEYKERI